MQIRSLSLSLGRRGGPSFGVVEWSLERLGGPVPNDFAAVAPAASLFAYQRPPTQLTYSHRSFLPSQINSWSPV